MRLEYLPDGSPDCPLIRLYDFRPDEAAQLGAAVADLAVQPTGASGSGSDQARRQQAEIIGLLLERGARPTDQDARGKPVDQAATSEWIRALLNEGHAG